MDGGYIKIFRSIKDWRWYKDPYTLKVFIHCIISANWCDANFQNVKVPRGSFITSYQHIANEVGISVQNVRTAISHLCLTGELTRSSKSKYTVITVVNYDAYQGANTVANKVANKQLTSNQQTTNKQLTTIEEYKEYKEYKEEPYHSYLDDKGNPIPLIVYDERGEPQPSMPKIYPGEAIKAYDDRYQTKEVIQDKEEWLRKRGKRLMEDLGNG